VRAIKELRSFDRLTPAEIHFRLLPFEFTPVGDDSDALINTFGVGKSSLRAEFSSRVGKNSRGYIIAGSFSFS
jgi:hypothetical protein